MSFLCHLAAGVRALLRKRESDRELDDELRAYLEASAAEKMQSGMSRDEAFRAARLELRGSPEGVKEIVRSSSWENAIETVWQDLRYAARQLRRSPGFATVAILTLALGIGANTAIFSAVYGILLMPLPYAHSSRLVTIGHPESDWQSPASNMEFRAIRQQSTVFDQVAVYQDNSSLILGGPVPEHRWVAYVSADFFPMLGVRPLLGRSILPADVQPGNDRVAVLSYLYWMDSFGGDPRVIGREIQIESKPYVVVGVMPREFELGVTWGGESSEGLWAPLIPVQSQDLWPLDTVVARLKDGANLAQANAQMQTVAARLAAQDPKIEKGIHLDAEILKRNPDSALDAALSILLGAVGFVLLIACVNLSALLIARAWTRQKEIAIRRTLGATPLRIARQLLSESMLLAVAGGALGLLFSAWGIRILRVIAPPHTDRLDRVALNGAVLWFTLGISLLAAILFGLAPAIQASWRPAGGALKEGLIGSFAAARTRRTQWMRGALTVLEVSLAVILVVGGALMLRSFNKLIHLDTGVRADHVLTMRVELQCDPVKSADCPAGLTDALDRVRSIVGVRSAAVSSGAPIGGGLWTQTGVIVKGQNGNGASVPLNLSGPSVTPDYFSTLGMRFLEGRDFTPNDVGRTPVPGIVSRDFARQYIQGDPLGKQFSLWQDNKGNPMWMEIVGVVNDVRGHAVEEPFGHTAYYRPFYPANNFGDVILRTSANPMAITPAVERAIWSVDKKATITQLETLDQFIADSSAAPRFQAVLLGSFGALALLLAIIGIYGVISYSVVQRTYEIGVRMSLGAQRTDVMRLVIFQGLRLALAGIVIGLAGALALTRVLTNLLFEVKPTDPATFIGVALLFLFVALAASYIPSRRAMRVDPLVALRHE